MRDVSDVRPLRQVPGGVGVLPALRPKDVRKLKITIRKQNCFGDCFSGIGRRLDAAPMEFLRAELVTSECCAVIPHRSQSRGPFEHFNGSRVSRVDFQHPEAAGFRTVNAINTEQSTELEFRCQQVPHSFEVSELVWGHRKRPDTSAVSETIDIECSFTDELARGAKQQAAIFKANIN